MQLPTGVEKLGEIENYSINIDWDEFTNGITAKEKFWSFNNSVIEFINLISNVVFWSNILFNLINGESLFNLSVESYIDLMFILSMCWLTAKVLSRYYKHEFPKSENILINKYFYPEVQKDLLGCFLLPRDEDSKFFANILWNHQQCQKIIRFNNIKFETLLNSTQEFLDDYRTRNWMGILIFEAAKLMLSDKSHHIRIEYLLQIILEKNSDINLATKL